MPLIIVFCRREFSEVKIINSWSVIDFAFVCGLLNVIPVLLSSCRRTVYSVWQAKLNSLEVTTQARPSSHGYWCWGGGEQDPYNQYVVSGCSTVDLTSSSSLKWAAVLPHHPSCQNRCAGVSKGAATENLRDGAFLFGGVVWFVRFSVKFIKITLTLCVNPG